MSFSDRPTPIVSPLEETRVPETPAPTPPAESAVDLRQILSSFVHDAGTSEEAQPAQILIVDGHEINRHLLKGMLRSGQHRFLEASSGLAALDIINRHPVDLIIADLMIPGLSGTELCRRVKANRKTQFIPILMITSVHGFNFEVEGIESGADEYLTKPLHPSVVRARVNSLLRQKSAVDSLEEAETILFALAQAVENRDQGTGAHCERLAAYSVAIGSALGLPRRDLVALFRGGFLHDIGKVAIPDAILLGSEKLTEAEWAIMKQHTIRGEDICRPMKSLAPVLPIIRNHHERWDGSGYPDGLAGEEIPLLARVLQVVDIFDALTTARTYKPAFSVDKALQMMQEECDRGWRDPELVSLFISMQRGSLLDPSMAFDSAWPELSTTLNSLQNMNRHLRE